MTREVHDYYGIQGDVQASGSKEILKDDKASAKCKYNMVVARHTAQLEAV